MDGSGSSPQDSDSAAPGSGSHAARHSRARRSPGRAGFEAKSGSIESNLIPDAVARALEGRTFGTFDEMRHAINVTWANTPGAAERFSPEDLAEMREGRNPYAPEARTLGKRVKMEYDHYKEVQDGASPYAIGNLRLVSPKEHVMKIGRIFNGMAQRG